MNIDILKKLASIAESLDSKGHYDESNIIDGIIEKISSKKPKAKADKGAKAKGARGAKGAKAKGAKGSGAKKAKKDYDGDGKIETSTQEYKGSVDKAIKARMKE